MKFDLKNLLLIPFILGILGCKSDSHGVILNELEKAALELEDYNAIVRSKVMVVGTFHFRKDILDVENQKDITKLIDVLSEYNPTKIVLEWEPSELSQTNKEYQSFLADTFDVSKKTNEVYQLGFRLAKVMQHDSIYLFDNQTEFIGSLENFTFDSFSEYAKQNDIGFYNEHEELMIETYENNQKRLNEYSLYDRSV